MKNQNDDTPYCPGLGCTQGTVGEYKSRHCYATNSVKDFILDLLFNKQSYLHNRAICIPGFYALKVTSLLEKTDCVLC